MNLGLRILVHLHCCSSRTGKGGGFAGVEEKDVYWWGIAGASIGKLYRGNLAFQDLINKLSLFVLADY